MGKKVDPEIVEREAANLSRLLGDRSRAAFGASLEPAIDRAMINQHEKAKRPISLDAAKAYAAGFGVPLNEISERWAKQLSNSAPTITNPPSPRKLVQQVCRLAEQIDDDGLKKAITAMRDWAQLHPATPVKPRAKAKAA